MAYNSNDSQTYVMEYMNRKITEKYNLLFFTQSEERHLQVYVLDNLLEIDIGFGCYEHAAALKPAFKVLFDNSGMVEAKMVKSREVMDERIYGDKQKKDLETACNYVGTHLMHAAVASCDVEDEYLTHDSSKFHMSKGYTQVAHMKAVGKKFDRWYDLLWYQKRL